jgi:broad specificity phosphatase PhoE
VLADRLAGFGLKYVVSSVEPKAVETAEIIAEQIGLPCGAEAGLHEHDRSNVSGLSWNAFQEAVAQLFEQPEALVFGTETAVEARERFASALSDVLAQHPTGSLAVVTHGTVLSLYVGKQAGLDPYALWQRLGLPCFVVLDRVNLDLVEIVPSISF